jgi:hypothetical protein
MTAVARMRATLLAALATCALPLGGAQASAAGTENVAEAFATEDNTQVFDFAWDISRERDIDVVDHRNKAWAHAQCVHCGATAIAFQTVLVSGRPTTVVPINTAEAVNEQCTECDTVAEARQFVRVFPQPVKLTPVGRVILADVRGRLAALRWQHLGPEQEHAVVETQEQRVLDVLRDELVLKSDPDQEADVVLQQRMLQADDLG